MATLTNITNDKKGYIDIVMQKTLFTSDTHFGSERTLELSKRPFNTVAEMDEYMIDQWNKIVAKHDTVIHLGDFGNFDVREQLNGKIILIQGNYEEEIPNKDILSKLDKNDIYITGTEDDHAYLNIDYNDCKYICFHRPIDHLVREKIKDISKEFFLFGHIHGRQFIKKFGIDVGVDCNHFRPITWDDVQFYQNAMVKKYYDDNVFC